MKFFQALEVKIRTPPEGFFESRTSASWASDTSTQSPSSVAPL
ncbi:hypothetical protein JOD27_002822 [Lentzea nigeriaca]|nr:hypothetical protein [Lentzea nigeriaca]